MSVPSGPKYRQCCGGILGLDVRWRAREGPSRWDTRSKGEARPDLCRSLWWNRFRPKWSNPTSIPIHAIYIDLIKLTGRTPVSAEGSHSRNKGDGRATSRVLYYLFRVHGISFFMKYSSYFFLTFTFSYLSKHLRSNSEKYASFSSFTQLYRKYFTLPYGVTQRYALLNYSPEELLDGPVTACMGARETCPTWDRIDRIREAVKSKEVDAKELMTLIRLARSLKLCGK